MDESKMFKFNKLMIFYLVKDALVARQSKILEKALLNPELSIKDGFALFEKTTENIEILNNNFNYIKEFLENLSSNDKKLLTEYVFKNKTAFAISKENNYHIRTFFRKWRKIVDKFFKSYSPSEEFFKLLGVADDKI